MHGEYKMPGGKLVVVDLEVRDGRLADVQVSGDFFLEPDSALAVINATLENQPAARETSKITDTLTTALGSEVSMFGVSAEAIAIAVQRALQAGAPA